MGIRKGEDTKAWRRELAAWLDKHPEHRGLADELGLTPTQEQLARWGNPKERMRARARQAQDQATALAAREAAIRKEEEERRAEMAEWMRQGDFPLAVADTKPICKRE
jgi:hypothetical protein